MSEFQKNTLNERSREILGWAISSFVSTGKPVGSRRIARHSREHLSAATVRNIMADLEEMGYLRQPHASAGRVPTDQGYRFYVDYMLQPREISPRDREIIDRNLKTSSSPEHLMAQASHVLSQVSNGIGIVVSPPISRVALQHIQFVNLADRRILVILVSRSGIVQNRVIQSDEEFSQVELDQAAHYIIDNYKDKTLVEIGESVARLVQHERASLYDRFMKGVVYLSTRTFSDLSESQSEVYLDGAANLIRTPEFSDINRMRMLFETIEQKSRLANLISQCIKGDAQEVYVRIGTENPLPGIADCTLISSRYELDERSHGSLAILGPTRMEYGRAISLVEYVARLFGRLLGNQGTV
jgi:heat-inducible transcriptional repressor